MTRVPQILRATQATRPADELAMRRRILLHVSGLSEPQAERLLVRAALVRDGQAIDAWRAWQRIARPVDDLPQEQHRLLPLLHANLKALGVNDSSLERYAGVRRFYWIRNRVIINTALPILSRLQKNGVAFLLLKGMSLQGLYDGSGLRPFSDVDLLVAPHALSHAMQILVDEGFRFQDKRLTDPATYLRYFKANHAMNLLRPDDRLDIDLHANLHSAAPSLALVDDLFARSGSANFGGQPMRTLSPAALIVHTALHAAGSHQPCVGRSIADVATIIRYCGADLSWEDVTLLGSKAEALTPLVKLVQDAYDCMGEPIPEHVVKTLFDAPRRISDRAPWRFIMAPGPLQRERKFMFFYLRAVQNDVLRRRRPRGPLSYLRDLISAPSRRATLLLLIRYSVRKILR